MKSFKCYKTAGADGILPGLLWEDLGEILSVLVKLLRANFQLNYIPQLRG